MSIVKILGQTHELDDRFTHIVMGPFGQIQAMINPKMGERGYEGEATEVGGKVMSIGVDNTHRYFGFSIPAKFRLWPTMIQEVTQVEVEKLLRNEYIDIVADNIRKISRRFDIGKQNFMVPKEYKYVSIDKNGRVQVHANEPVYLPHQSWVAKTGEGATLGYAKVDEALDPSTLVGPLDEFRNVDELMKAKRGSKNQVATNNVTIKARSTTITLNIPDTYKYLAMDQFLQLEAFVAKPTIGDNPKWSMYKSTMPSYVFPQEDQFKEFDLLKNLEKRGLTVDFNDMIWKIKDGMKIDISHFFTKA